MVNILMGAKGWRLTKNACETPMCIKKLNSVTMIVFKGINGKPCELHIHMNPYIPQQSVNLHFHDWESACNEADDVYRGLLTKAIEYLIKQIQLLPDI